MESMSSYEGFEPHNSPEPASHVRQLGQEIAALATHHYGPLVEGPGDFESETDLVTPRHDADTFELHQPKKDLVVFKRLLGDSFDPDGDGIVAVEAYGTDHVTISWSGAELTITSQDAAAGKAELFERTRRSKGAIGKPSDYYCSEPDETGMVAIIYTSGELEHKAFKRFGGSFMLHSAIRFVGSIVPAIHARAMHGDQPHL